MGIIELLSGWERCDPPSWWSAERQRKKGIPNSFTLKGKTFVYKAIYKGYKGFGGPATRFEASYKFYRKGGRNNG